jgi:pilus assembly protein Flp/PilA
MAETIARTARRRLSSAGGGLKRRLGRLACDERGATAVEYGLIVALIVLAMIGALRSVAGATIDMWGDVSNNVVVASR